MAGMTALAVLADDLTGAMDAAVTFADLGLKVLVATSVDHLPQALEAGPDVVAVSLRSREGGVAAAVAAVERATALLVGVPQVFKKIDSRLKGHVAAEASALAQARGLGQALLCPAIPGMGRVVRRGYLQGFGVAGPVPVLGDMRDWSGLAVTAPDAESDADLDRMVAGAGPDVLLVGARGLAAALARRMGRAAVAHAIALPLPLPATIAVGTRDPITLAQVAALLAAGGDVLHVRPGDPPPQRLAAITILQAGVALQGGSAEQITAAFAARVPAWTTGRRSLILTGGETATAVLDRMGLHVLQLRGEVLPGLPLAEAVDAIGAPLIVTKSGGFGAADILQRLVLPQAVPVHAGKATAGG